MPKKTFAPIAGAVCPYCKSRNTNLLEKTTHECYDCGKTYDEKPRRTFLRRPVNDAKAGDTDRACIKASLGVHGLINIGGYKIQEKDLYNRIIDKIPGAQFHKIIMTIAADLKKEEA